MSIEDEIGIPTREIGRGLVILLGVGVNDTEREVEWMAEKTANLRIFEDEEEKMNLSLLDIGGEALVVSQFTLYGDIRKGRRPNFIDASPPEKADELYRLYVDKLQKCGLCVQTGRFRAKMMVCIENDGPVTLTIDTEDSMPAKSK